MKRLLLTGLLLISLGGCKAVAKKPQCDCGKINNVPYQTQEPLLSPMR